MSIGWIGWPAIFAVLRGLAIAASKALGPALRSTKPPCPKFSDLTNVPACDCRPNRRRILELSRQGLGCRRGRLDQAVSGTPWSTDGAQTMKSLTAIAFAAALFAGATTASA